MYSNESAIPLMFSVLHDRLAEQKRKKNTKDCLIVLKNKVLNYLYYYY